MKSISKKIYKVSYISLMIVYFIFSLTCILLHIFSVNVKLLFNISYVLIPIVIVFAFFAVAFPAKVYKFEFPNSPSILKAGNKPFSICVNAIFLLFIIFMIVGYVRGIYGKSIFPIPFIIELVTYGAVMAGYDNKSKISDFEQKICKEERNRSKKHNKAKTVSVKKIKTSKKSEKKKVFTKDKVIVSLISLGLVLVFLGICAGVGAIKDKFGADTDLPEKIAVDEADFEATVSYSGIATKDDINYHNVEFDYGPIEYGFKEFELKKGDYRLVKFSCELKNKNSEYGIFGIDALPVKNRDIITDSGCKDKVAVDYEIDCGETKLFSMYFYVNRKYDTEEKIMRCLADNNLSFEAILTQGEISTRQNISFVPKIKY